MLYAALTSWAENVVLELYGLRHVAQNDAWLCTKPNCFAQEGGSHIICLRFRTCSVTERALRILVDISFK